ncbi:hypothetical protein U2F10_03150 [Leptothoe sp. EHU-05/26/07-4]
MITSAPPNDVHETNEIWIPRDASNGDALTTEPVSLDVAVELQKHNPQGVRLDTTNGGGAGSWTYPMDDMTEVAHKLLANKLQPFDKTWTNLDKVAQSYPV